jgi:hypothetical protein
LLLSLALTLSCAEQPNIESPYDEALIMESLEITPGMDSGSPLPMQVSGNILSMAFSSTFNGTGDIYSLELYDFDEDGYYESYPVTQYFPNEFDSTLVITVPNAVQFTEIGHYESSENGASHPSYPGGVYFAGPRQLAYDSLNDRIFYSMGFTKLSQIASTTSPLSGSEYDPPLDEVYNSGAGRPPNWQYWYTKKNVAESDTLPVEWGFTGGNYATVSIADDFGQQWLAFADTTLEHYDRDWDVAKGEDPIGSIESQDGGSDDGAPGYLGVDDDNDGLADFQDPEVSVMQDPDPAEGSAGWNMRNYIAAHDDDEDGLMDEDPNDGLDNDGDGEIDEDNPGDWNDDDWPGTYQDDDGDGLANFEDREVRHAQLRASLSSGYVPADDDDEDGISDEDADIKSDGLWIVKLNVNGLPDAGQLPRALTDDGGRQPFFNPVNEEELLYVDGGDLFRLNLAFEGDSVTVAERVQLTDTSELESYPSYSADGSRIVYSSGFYGSSDLWIMDADGGNPWRVTNNPGQELFPRFTPSGMQILYEAWTWPDGERRILLTLEELSP